MTSRVYYSATDTGRETTTSSDFSANHVSLTFTPNASKTYLLLWSAVLDSSSAAVDPKARLYHDTAAAALQEFVVNVGDTTDRMVVQGAAIYVEPGSPASQTFSIRYGGGTTVGIQYGIIVALELGANDLYSTTAGEASTTSATYATLDTVTPGAGDWIIIASASANIQSGATNGRWRVQNTTDSTTVFEQTAGGSAAAGRYYPFWSVRSIDGLAGSKTHELQHAEVGGTTVNTRQRTIVALKKSDFPAEYSAEQVARATITGAGSDSPNDRTTLTETTAAGDHLLLAAFTQDNSSGSVSVRGDVTEDGSALCGTLEYERPAVGAIRVEGLVGIRDLTAASHTFKIRYWNETTTITGGIAEATIHLLQVEDVSTSGSVSPPVANITLTAPAPTVLATSSGAVAPPAAPITLAAPEPTVSITSTGNVAPPAAPITLAAPEPTVTGSQSGAVAPPAANITLAAPEPTVVGNQSGVVAPPAADIVLAAPEPTVVGSTEASVVPPTAIITLAAPEPTVFAAAAGTVEPPTTNITLAAPEPTVAGHQSGSVQPPLIDIVLAAPEPVVFGDSTTAVSAARRGKRHSRRSQELVQLPTGEWVTLEMYERWLAIEQEDEILLLTG